MTDVPVSGQPAAAGPGDAVAVLGTGIMGSAMARNLVAAGLSTTVWDRSAPAVASLAGAGALAAASPQDAVRDAQVVITMLPTADVVESVMFDGGVTDAFARGAVWAQMGTIGVAATTGLAGGSAACGRMCCSWTRRCQAARARPRPGGCSSWPLARLRRRRSWPRRSR